MKKTVNKLQANISIRMNHGTFAQRAHIFLEYNNKPYERCAFVNVDTIKRSVCITRSITVNTEVFLTETDDERRTATTAAREQN